MKCKIAFVIKKLRDTQHNIIRGGNNNDLLLNGIQDYGVDGFLHYIHYILPLHTPHIILGKT